MFNRRFSEFDNPNNDGAVLMSKHTPGPWDFFQRERKTKPSTFVIGANPEIDVCESEMTEADARLIAAAPELLEVAKTFLETLHTLDATMKPFLGDEITQGSIFDLRGAKANLQRLIKKAEGEK